MSLRSGRAQKGTRSPGFPPVRATKASASRAAFISAELKDRAPAILELPEEVLCRILSHLPHVHDVLACGQVCKEWFKALQSDVVSSEWCTGRKGATWQCGDGEGRTFLKSEAVFLACFLQGHNESSNLPCTWVSHSVFFHILSCYIRHFGLHPRPCCWPFTLTRLSFALKHLRYSFPSLICCYLFYFPCPSCGKAFTSKHGGQKRPQKRQVRSLLPQSQFERASPSNRQELEQGQVTQELANS
jgi:hypothetical protein